MSKENEITVRSYDREAQAYIDKTPAEVTGSVKVLLDTFLSYLDKSSEILEIGSGTGRDASYMESKGFKVMRTDAAQAFVAHLVESGRQALVLDIIHDALPEKYSAIFATGVFLHFNDADFDLALHNVLKMLKPEGIFALSLHKGNFRGMSDHKLSTRYFQEWTEDGITKFLGHYDFEILKMMRGKSISNRNKDWILLLLRKRDGKLDSNTH